MRGGPSASRADVLPDPTSRRCGQLLLRRTKYENAGCHRQDYVHLLFHDLGDAFYEDFCELRVVYSPELVRWFQDMVVPNVVTDTIANEVTADPNNGAAPPLHRALMRNLGGALTEISDLEKLAERCANDGQYTLLYAATLSKVSQANGSPVNHMVIR